MNWNEIRKLPLEKIASVWPEARARAVLWAFSTSRDLTEWTQYLKNHPPSPETLAFLILLSLEYINSRIGRKAGRASGIARRAKALYTPELVEREYQSLMKTGTAERNIAAKLSVRWGITPNYIRKLRKKANNKT